jgi:hypothetical protein
VNLRESGCSAEKDFQQNSRIHPISGSCVHKSMPKACSRWLLRSSSIRHSPLDALDLPGDPGSDEGHPQLSLKQGNSLAVSRIHFPFSQDLLDAFDCLFDAMGIFHQGKSNVIIAIFAETYPR